MKYPELNEEPLSVQEERAQYGEEKPKAKDTARLIWASKPKKEPNAKDLEFQTAEEVYPNIADVKDKKLSRFWAETKDINDDPNRLIWGDNLLVMQALLANGYEGQIDLIYIDPPFNTGENFNFPNSIKIGREKIETEMPISERLAYTDTWGRGKDSFLDMMYPRIQLMRKLLSEKGTLYVHCDDHVSHYLKVMLDEVFGEENFVNEIIWERSANTSSISKIWKRSHDTILMYSKTNKYIFNFEYRELAENTLSNYRYEDKNGKYRIVPILVSGLRNGKTGSIWKGIDPTKRGRYGMHWITIPDKLEEMDKQGLLVWPENKESLPGLKYYLESNKGVVCPDIWDDISPIQSSSKEALDYPTQKPIRLMERIINVSSNEGDLVADFFCGSGTTARAAEGIKRRWIISDLSKTAIQVSRGELVNQGSSPFLIQNLGNYQRQLIYSKEIKLKEMYNIVLKLYGATPRTDWQGFGISKEDNKTLVFVCEPDRPMTGKKAVDLAKSAKTADGKGYKRLIILAWDFEYDFDDTFQRLTKNSKRDLADVEFKIIPSDVYKYLRSTKVGDQDLANKITFYEKPYLRLSEPQVSKRDKEEAQVKIKIEQYVLRDIPVKDESKRPEIEKMLHKNFANLIDYWTVDWDYDGEVFRSKWQAIRERKSSDPVSTTADTTLKRGKKYIIAVRVVDVFGNDASLTKEIDLR